MQGLGASRSAVATLNAAAQKLLGKEVCAGGRKGTAVRINKKKGQLVVRHITGEQVYNPTTVTLWSAQQ